jgi:hypothetical protein
MKKGDTTKSRGKTMSEKTKHGAAPYEGAPVPADSRKQKRKNGRDPLPGVSLRELLAERNWTALAGLGLIALGVLWIVANFLNIHFALWAWVMMALGGGLMFDAWQTYSAAGRVWIENTRNRMLGGGVIALVGLMGALNLSWWAVMLLVIAGWLAHKTWKEYTASGRTWTARVSNRFFAAGLLGLIGLSGLTSVWSVWPLLLVVIGGVMLYRHLGGKTCC